MKRNCKCLLLMCIHCWSVWLYALLSVVVKGVAVVGGVD